MRKSILILSLGMLIISLFIIDGCKVSSLTRDDIAKNDFPIATIDDSLNVMASELYVRLAASDLLSDGGILDSTTYFDTLKSIVLDSIYHFNNMPSIGGKEWIGNLSNWQRKSNIIKLLHIFISREITQVAIDLT